MAEISWLVPAASIIAALIVAIANASVQKRRQNIDRLDTSVERFCAEINAAADLGTEYWLIESTQETHASLRRLEAQLIGRQTRLQELALALRAQDSRFPLEAVELALPDLYEAMTGGDFQVADRAASPELAKSVQASAAHLNGALRHALSARFRWW